MNIYILSRKAVLQLLDDNEHKVFKDNYVISIYSTGSESPFTITKGFSRSKNILKLQFDDIAYYKEDWEMEYVNDLIRSRGYKYITDKQVKEIADFLNAIDVNRGKDLIIHCDAGISRSGAVGLVADKKFNVGRDAHMRFRLTNSHIRPNPYAYAKLAELVLGEPYNKTEQYKLEKKYNKRKEKK